MLRSGGLFSGSGMLELVVESVFGAQPAWFCEHEPPTETTPKPNQAAARLLAYRFPGVPNLGDVTRVDWSAVEPVDVLTMGFPCTDVSAAGKRAGLRPGTRSGLWSHGAYAIACLHPKLVVIENVRGLLSSDADCDLEPCPWCVGDDQGRPLRALGAVLGDLASLGYDATWCGLLASDVGAPHPRFRVFILAWPATDALDPQHHGSGPAGSAQRRGWVRPGPPNGGVVVTDPAGAGWGHLSPDDVGHDGAISVRSGQTQSGRRDRAVADASGEGRGTGRGVGRPVTAPVVGDGAPPVTDSDRDPVWEQSERVTGGGGAPIIGRTGALVPDPEGGGEPNEPASGDAIEQPVGAVVGTGDRDSQRAATEGVQQLVGAAAVVAWGVYEPAIRRWERITGQLAPAPTVTGQRGGQRLSPYFVEWMMGWPTGWATGVPGLSHNDMIRILGNGIVPQQGLVAVQHLRDHYRNLLNVKGT